MSFHKLFRTLSVLIGIIVSSLLLSSCNISNAPVPEVEKGYGGEGGGHGGGHGGAGGH
jgi:hypothetical protein